MPLSRKAHDELEEKYPPGSYIVFDGRLLEVEEWSPRTCTLVDCATEAHRNMMDENMLHGVRLVRRPAVPDTIEFGAVDEPAA
jgi:hypothetical protein